jgi:hypothetical protein
MHDVVPGPAGRETPRMLVEASAAASTAPASLRPLNMGGRHAPAARQSVVAGVVSVTTGASPIGMAPKPGLMELSGAAARTPSWDPAARGNG